MPPTYFAPARRGKRLLLSSALIAVSLAMPAVNLLGSTMNAQRSHTGCLAAATPQQHTPGGSRTRDWWKQFNDPVLDGLVDEAIASNRDLAVAYERVTQARAARRGARSGLLPSVEAGASFSRQRTSERIGLTSAAGGGKQSITTLQARMRPGSWMYWGACGVRLRPPRRAASHRGSLPRLHGRVGRRGGE